VKSGQIASAAEGSLTYRLKYKTKDGERLTSHTYRVKMFP
jgi:hypothetical protein